MTENELEKVLEALLGLPKESEIVEFKEAKLNFDFRKLGKYFSALSNEANLKKAACGWLIFGVEDKTHSIVGTKFRETSGNLHSLKSEIANKTTNRITFIEIYERTLHHGRVVMFQIPPAPRGLPVAFEGHCYARDGEELVPLNIEEFERIRYQANVFDWSSEIIANATIEDLDIAAIKAAKENFKNKFPDKALEVEKWDDITFLNKAKITLKGKITRSAILLLGREESEHYLNPSEGKIRWVLRDAKDNDRDYAIFTLPFLLAVDRTFNKIRNLKYRYLKEGTLFPDEIDQYEPFTIREALNNCIAHQDYTKSGRVNVIEYEDKLIFTNKGEFIPGSVEKVIIDDSPEERYRNPFLVTAMFNLKMVDTIGGGIKRMFVNQRERYFPMPDYDFSNGRVKVTITGTVLDLNYSKLLASRPDLSLNDVIILDKISKKIPVSSNEVKILQKMKLIEGRGPNYFISALVSQETGKKAEYSKNKALNKNYYLTLILTAIEQHGFLDRKDIDDLLWVKLPDWMSDVQRKAKIKNLLFELRSQDKIENTGSRKAPRWIRRTKVVS